MLADTIEMLDKVSDIVLFASSCKSSSFFEECFECRKTFKRILACKCMRKEVGFADDGLKHSYKGLVVSKRRPCRELPGNIRKLPPHDLIELLLFFSSCIKSFVDRERVELKEVYEENFGEEFFIGKVIDGLEDKEKLADLWILQNIIVRLYSKRNAELLKCIRNAKGVVVIAVKDGNLFRRCSGFYPLLYILCNKIMLCISIMEFVDLDSTFPFFCASGEL